MPLAFIPLGIAALLIAVGVLSLFVPRVRSFLKILPIFKPQIWGIALIVVGVVAGGVGWYQTSIATITGEIVPPPEVPETLIEKCVYSAGVSTGVNITVRENMLDRSRVYLDVDESGWDATEDAAITNEVNINFTCFRAGSIQEDGAAHIVVNSPLFLNQVTTSDAAMYSIVDDSASMSAVWTGMNEQTIYVGEGGVGTTDTVEEVYLTFSEGEKELTLGILADLSQANLVRTNNFSIIDINAYQRLETTGAEVKVASIGINHIP